MRKCVFLSLLALAISSVASEAAPIYVVGGECPSDAQMPSYSRQYYVTQATNCVFQTITTGQTGNIDGFAEADLYLNSALGTAAGWGTAISDDDWKGLGKTPVGFSFTADAGNDDGTFTFSTALTTTYNQFALGIKDGGNPKWAIFMLPVNVFTGNWGFGTEGGDLSHFGLYARHVDLPPPPMEVTEVPEPASLLLLGSGLTLAARRKRAKR